MVQKVGDLLAHAQAVAVEANSDTNARWVAGSHSLAAACGLLEISFHIQSLGRLDVLLRSLEHEAIGRDPTVPITLQESLSRYWVLEAYEAVRTVSDRWHDVERRLAELLRQLELVRVPLAKLRIAQDQKGLRGGATVELLRRGDPPDAPGETYASDGLTRYWPQTLFNPINGSVGWEVVDLRHQVQAQVLRQHLSDEFLALFAAIGQRRLEGPPAQI